MEYALYGYFLCSWPTSQDHRHILNSVSLSLAICISLGLHTILNLELLFFYTGCHLRLKNLPYYLIHSWREFISFRREYKQKWMYWNSAGMWPQLSDFLFQDAYPLCHPHIFNWRWTFCFLIFEKNNLWGEMSLNLKSNLQCTYMPSWNPLLNVYKNGRKS